MAEGINKSQNSQTQLPWTDTTHQGPPTEELSSSLLRMYVAGGGLTIERVLMKEFKTWMHTNNNLFALRQAVCYLCFTTTELRKKTRSSRNKPYFPRCSSDIFRPEKNETNKQKINWAWSLPGCFSNEYAFHFSNDSVDTSCRRGSKVLGLKTRWLAFLLKVLLPLSFFHFSHLQLKARVPKQRGLHQRRDPSAWQLLACGKNNMCNKTPFFQNICLWRKKQHM